MGQSVLKRNVLFSQLGGSSGGGGGTVNSIVAGRNITVDSTDPANPIVATTADDITVVANYSALPAVGIAIGEFYWCSASQGTSWLPGSLGGTYYSAGLYYSNGVTWEFMDVPYQATQSEVNTGTNTDKFVTPATLTNWTGRTLVVGTTSISGGVASRILYDNAGVLGEYTLTGTGTVVAMATSPTFVTSANITAITATTNAADVLQTYTNNSSGTPAANYGIDINFKLKSSTTDSQDAGKQRFYWTDATHATRDSAYLLQVVRNGTLIDAYKVLDNAGQFEHQLFGPSGGYATLQFYSGTTKKFTFESSTDAYMSTWTAGAVMYFRAGNASTYNASISNVGMWIGSNASGQTPTSSLQVAGSFSAAYVAKTANYTATISDYTIDCTANSFTVTLPTAVGITGRIYVINNSTATTITLNTTSSQTIDGNASGVLTLAANKSYTVQSTGANWIIIAQK